MTVGVEGDRRCETVGGSDLGIEFEGRRETLTGYVTIGD